MMAVIFPCLLLSVILDFMALDTTYGFQSYLGRIRNPSLVDRSIPLLTKTTINSSAASAIVGASTTVLFMNGMEADPLEDDRSHNQRRLNEKRLVPHQKKGPASSSPPNTTQQRPQTQKPRLVRPKNTNEGIGANANERKATTSTVGGVNLELKDPKERVLVRHATASAAYGVDDFKGKKKKIIKPWRSGRKKHRNKQSNIGGLGREAYGEELRIEIKNKPREKRLVMARSNTSGSQDAAKALISGGSKAKPLTATEIAEAERIRRRKERKRDDFYYEDDDYHEEDEEIDFDNIANENTVENADQNTDEPNLVPLSTSMAEQPELDGDEKPNLVRLSTSMVRQPESVDDEDEPNLVRLSSSMVRKAEEEDKGEPNLVRLDSSIVKEPEEEPEGELRFYSRSDVSEEDDTKEGEQRLVRAVPASPSSSSDGPKLVRPNFMKTKDNGPKLTRPNIVKAKSQGPKLVRPNLVRPREVGPKLVRATVQKEKSSSAESPRLVSPMSSPALEKEEGPKLVRANVQREKTQKRKLVRPKIGSVIPDKKKILPSPRLVPPETTARTVQDETVADLMYGVSASTSNPTAVPLEVKPTRLVKPTFTTRATRTEVFTYGSGHSSNAPISIPIESKTKKLVRMPNTTHAPTAVTLENMNSKKNVGIPASTENSVMDNLMYGATQAMSSPTAVPLEVKPKQENTDLISSDDKVSIGTKPKRLVKPEVAQGGSDSIAMDDLMYGYQRATSPPTEVKVETKSTKLVDSKLGATVEDTSQDNFPKSTTIYPDGDKRKVFNEPRLVRASTQKRYVKPSTSVMNDAPDWDAANPTATTTNPTFVNVKNHDPDSNDNEQGKGQHAVGKSKEKKYVRPSTSLMNSAPDWDAVQSTFSVSNPVAVKFDARKSKKEIEQSPEDTMENPELAKTKNINQKKYVQPSVSSMDSVPNWDAVEPASTISNPSVVTVHGPKEVGEAKAKSEAENPKQRKYVQPSASVMDNAPDWDAVKPATRSSNPSIVKVKAPKPKVESKDKSVAEEHQKTYVQPSSSLMDKAPDWDAAKPPLAISNPTFVNVDDKKSIQETKDDSVPVDSKTKKYIKPSGSLMKNAPDWDAVQPPMATSNPSVLTVDSTKSRTENQAAKQSTKKKKYVRPSASMMENAPDWDAVKPALSTSNPSVVRVVVSLKPDVNTKSGKIKNRKEEKPSEERKKQRYVKASVSLMDSAPDWNAVQPAVTTSNPSVVNLDGIIRIGEGKRLVRPSSVSMNPETEQKTRPKPADKPFEYKQVQSIPNENPAGARPVQDEEEKTKLPASIAHAAGSSSDGWTPAAHFPSDDKTNSTRTEDPSAKVKRTRSSQSSTMENFDPDALPRPTGVIPLTVSSSTKDKTQLFREEHSLEPVEDEPDNQSSKNETVTSSVPKQSTPSGSEPGKKKLFLYDGGNPQPKELWEFSVEAPDTKLDQDTQQEMSTTKKKLVAYDRNAAAITNESIQDQNKDDKEGNFRQPGGGRRLKEKTVSPFTRRVSDAEESAGDSVAEENNESDKDAGSVGMN